MQNSRVSTRFLGFALAALGAVSAPAQTTPQEWFDSGQATLEANAALTPNTKKAKNVILFVGDGMGVSTVTAARILEGQMRGESGEENKLSFEKFPYLALSKVYNVNSQVPDSAGTMTSMMTGVKTNIGVIGYNQNTTRCQAATASGNELMTLLEQAESIGMATGVISTARITHATPAATYSHSADRNWEDDRDIPDEQKAAGAIDIAAQLIDFPYGDGLEVAMGGGRRSFLPRETSDPEDAGRTGERTDGRNLAAEWQRQTPNSVYVWNKRQFDALSPRYDRILGLFERSHLEYEADRPNDTAGEPSLSDMTGKAIEVLKRKGAGFFLHVESGRIDHAHHGANAHRALIDTIEFAKAIQTAVENTDPEETLIVVTADHSHVFTIAGYPERGNPILGKAAARGNMLTDALGLPYTTLGYQNGPGYTGASSQPEGPKSAPHFGDNYQGITQGRPDLTNVDTEDLDYLQETAVPLSSETHSGEEVAIYATGPWAHLFRGTVEQNYVYHVMAKALGFPR